MRISCPNCTATYDVPAELAAGRPVVRCVQCTQEWKLGQTPAPSTARPAIQAEPLLDPIPAEILGRQPEPEPTPPDTLEKERAAPVPSEPMDEPAPLAAEIAGHDLETATVVEEEPVAQAAEPPPAPAPASAAVSPVRKESALRLVLASVAGNLFAVTGWAFSLGLIMALGWMAIQHRTGIMHAWPPSQRLFNWLGLA
jgi:predicted Zn finger-like uncharacterized protein